MIFSEKLKKLRCERGISQAGLAEALHVSRSAVAKWENGLGMPSKESIAMIAEYFGISEDELVVKEGDHKTEKMSEKDKRVIIRAAIISVSLAIVLTIMGIFIEPIGQIISSGGVHASLIIINVANILRIRAQRKKEEENKNEDGK